MNSFTARETLEPREINLDYLREYTPGSRRILRRRNVILREGNVRRHIPDFRSHESSSYCWHLARRLEGREHVSDSEGVWPINFWRCVKRYGDPGRQLFPAGLKPDFAPVKVNHVALELRCLGYYSVANAAEAVELLRAGKSVAYATEITSEWYDPPYGRIEVVDDSSPVLGSHAVPILRLDRSDGECFVFRNSWGGEWGYLGQGSITPKHFDRYLIEAWESFGLGRFVPVRVIDNVTCLEWKWSLNNEISVHGRELIDSVSHTNLGWAFCRRRGGYLDLEEFYVWPTERGKGHGHTLAAMVTKLAGEMGLPLRMLVHYADTESENIDRLNAAARILNVQLEESNQRSIHMIGTQSPAKVERTVIRPQRPAFMLEMLRPRDELPIETPIDYSLIFGTNRCPERSRSQDVDFGPGRDSVLHTGVTAVRIPRTHKFGSKGRWWIRYWNRLIGKHSKVLASRIFSDELAFKDELEIRTTAFGYSPHNLLFVHGFNVSFRSAAIQAAQFGVDLKVPGSTFLYSWPSIGGISNYLSDGAAIEASAPYFRQFVDLILEQSGDVPLSIVAHSMGNRAVTTLLEALAHEKSTAISDRLRHVIFAAPDVDADVFKNAATQFLTIPKTTTLYASRADLALIGSEKSHNFHRAGLAPPVLVLPRLDTILVEGFNLLTLGHSYFAAASAVLHDMFALLHYDTKPNGRPNLVETKTVAGDSYWKLAL